MSTLIGIGIYTLFYTIFVVGGVEDDCDAEVRVPSQSQRAAFQWHALFLGCLTVVFVSITVIFVREQEGMCLLFDLVFNVRIQVYLQS